MAVYDPEYEKGRRMTPGRLRVTVEGPSGSVLVSVAENAGIADVLPGIVEACEGGRDAAGWSLAPWGEAALAGGRTVAEIGLFDGAVLRLIAPEPPVAEPAPERVAPPPPPIDSMSELAYRRVLDGAIAAPAPRPTSVIASVG